MYRAPASPATDATFTTDPCLRITIAGMNACVQRNVPVAFTASTRFQSSSVILPSGALCAAPALLTRISTTPARRAAAWVRLCTLAASVTSHWTAHALPPPPRISAATFSMRSAVRAAMTMAAPSAARACAIAAPIPRPPPVTTATEPSNRGKHRLLEDRAQRFDQARAFVRGRGCGIAEVGTRPTGRLERALTRLDRLRQRAGVRRERCADRLAHGLGPLGDHDRAFELSRVTGAAPELIAESRAPRFAREIGKDDRQQPVGVRKLHRLMQRGEMLGVEVHVRERE